jgi:hypothetical protein
MKLFVVCVIGLCALSLFGLLSCRDPNAPKIPETTDQILHFAENAMPHSVLNVLNDLKKEGNLYCNYNSCFIIYEVGCRKCILSQNGGIVWISLDGN